MAEVVYVMKKRKLLHRKSTLERSRQKERCPPGWELVGDDYAARKKLEKEKKKKNWKEKLKLRKATLKLLKIAKTRLSSPMTRASTSAEPSDKSVKQTKSAATKSKKALAAKAPALPKRRRKNSPTNHYLKVYKTRGSRTTRNSLKANSTVTSTPAARRTPPLTRRSSRGKKGKESADKSKKDKENKKKE